MNCFFDMCLIKPLKALLKNYTETTFQWHWNCGGHNGFGHCTI